MSFMQWTPRLVVIFESRIQRRISYTRLSKLLKRGKTFIIKILAHVRGPRIGDLIDSLEAAGDELAVDYFHHAFEKVAGDPLLILACNRRRQGLAPSPFLVAMAPRILALIDAGPSPGRRWRSRLEKIRRFEKLRFQDRKLAQEKLEWAVDLGVALLERPGARPAAALGDLACALSSLAVAYRTSGRLDDALDSLLLAYPLAMAVDDPLVEGIWYQKAAYLLVYLGRCDRAYEFVQEASTHFIEADAKGDQAKTLVDIGFVLSRAGRREEACKRLRRALGIVPRSEREYLFAAHQILAGNLAILGNLPEAITELERAGELADDAKLLLGLVHWSRGKLCVLQGALGAAGAAFREALQLHQTYGSPADVADLTFDYAASLIRERNRPELERLAAGVSTFFSETECDLEVRESIEDFVALVTMRQLVAASFKDLRKKLPQSNQREGSLAETIGSQPPGGHSQPISSSSPVSELLFGGKAPPTGSATAG